MGITDTTDEADGGNAERFDWRTAANLAGLALLLVLVLPFVLYAVPQVAGADQGYVVTSGSMEPTFSAGDVILVESAPPKSVSEGDVVTFERSGEEGPTTHRVVEVVMAEGELAFRTKGDANEDPDTELVNAGEIEGTVLTLGGSALAIPYVGYVIQFAATTTGIVVFLVAPLALLALSEVYVLIRDSRRREDGTDTSEDTAEAADGAPETPASSPPDADGAGDAADEDGFTLTPTDLRLTVGVLTLFAAYTVWVAYTDITVWSVTIAATIGATLLLVGGMYLFGGAPPEDDQSDDGRPVATHSLTKRTPRRHETAMDGGSRQLSVRAAGTPWTGSDATLRGGPVDARAPGEGGPGLNDSGPEPHTPSGTADIKASPDASTSTPEPGISGEEPESATAEVTSTESMGDPVVTPAPTPPRGALTSAVTPLEAGSTGSTVTATGSDAGTGIDADADGSPTGSPVFSALHQFLYYVGFVVVEPPRSVYQLLSNVGGEATSTGKTDKSEMGDPGSTPNSPVVEGELEPAIVGLPSGTRSERVVPNPTPSSDELTAAVRPLEAGSTGATVAASGSDVGTDVDGNGFPAENPVFSVLHRFLYYVGFVIVEPPRFIYHSLSGVNGGDNDD